MIRRLLVFPESAAALAILGGMFGAVAVGLAALGNPPATGLCASCFLVNAAGALHLHARAAQSYLRPELLGIVLGAFFASFAAREFRVRGGSSPLFHLVGGVFLILGCEVFIGCPIKALLRTAGGGATALVGVVGLVGGVALSIPFLADGFALPAKRALPDAAGLALPAAAFALLAASSLGAGPFAAGGPGGPLHAPFAVSAAAGLFFGAAGQRSRFCITGSVKNAVVARDFRDALGAAAFLLVALALSAARGSFSPTLAFEPGAHTDLLWAFLAMAVVGFGAILLSGCPFRQLVLAAGGDLDACAGVAGMLLGASLSVSLGIASSPDGVTSAGKLAVLAGAVFFLAAARRKAGRGA